MKRISLLLLFLASFALSLSAQSGNVVWNLSYDHIKDNVYRIVLSADIKDGWHIYGTEDYGKAGPTSTSVRFLEGEGYELTGDVESKFVESRNFDENFGIEIGIIEGHAEFSQEIRLNAENVDVKCEIEWMACNETSCTPPQDAVLSVSVSGTAGTGPEGLWGMILAAILWGFAALLTPCVFPMIPMTVSFFIKGSKDKAAGKFRAAMYGLFIVLLYTVPISIIILITRIIGGEAVTADIFNWLATHWLPNILFFIVFMCFAASFFGAFEIVMPSKLVNGSDSQVDRKKGLGGVFFLALTLVLVSFSCTGPIVGTVLIKSTSGEFWAPMVTMLAFSLAFALPFVLFALFPGILSRLPKSGGWLNSVKVVLGFIEVALGFKFLSTADQVYHWGLLDREVYLAIWIVCFAMLGFYLLGKLRFKNDSELEYIGTLRLALSIAVFSFVVYMVPGMWGAPLKALSGYLPPMETQDFVLDRYSTAVAPSMDSGTVADVEYSDLFELPHGLSGYFTLEEAREAAAASGKPVFIDFTGHGCVNCREMESRVWSDPEVLSLLNDSFVICALYTDDKTKLPESDWVTTDDGRVLKTIGKINSEIALKQYGVNAQPNYIIESAEGEILCPARGYDLDPKAFAAWLKEGLKNE